jgi:hypothetical protein
MNGGIASSAGKLNVQQNEMVQGPYAHMVLHEN